MLNSRLQASDPAKSVRVYALMCLTLCRAVRGQAQTIESKSHNERAGKSGSMNYAVHVYVAIFFPDITDFGAKPKG